MTLPLGGSFHARQHQQDWLIMAGLGLWIAGIFLMKDMRGFFIFGAVIVVVLVGFHVSADGYLAPVANVWLTLNDGHATEEHCFEGTRIVCEQARTGYNVRGGTLRARVTGVAVPPSEGGERRAYASVNVEFDLDGNYRGWGWSDLDRPTLYGFIVGARSVGEGTDRHTATMGGMTLLEPIGARRGTHDAIAVDGVCSTDYGHDLCRFRATVPVTGDTQYLQIHLRERFR